MNHARDFGIIEEREEGEEGATNRLIHTHVSALCRIGSDGESRQNR